MRRGRVYLDDQPVGVIEELEEVYRFQYDLGYDGSAISLVLPVTDEPYDSDLLHPFFDGLIPEGWLLDLTVHNWKIDARDRMGLLLAVCEDCVGAVRVVADE